MFIDSFKKNEDEHYLRSKKKCCLDCGRVPRVAGKWYDIDSGLINGCKTCLDEYAINMSKRNAYVTQKRPGLKQMLDVYQNSRNPVNTYEWK